MPRIVPYYAPIWESIRFDKMLAVRELLKTLKCSPFDIRQDGTNLLYVSYLLSNHLHDPQALIEKGWSNRLGANNPTSMPSVFVAGISHVSSCLRVEVLIGRTSMGGTYGIQDSFSSNSAIERLCPLL